MADWYKGRPASNKPIRTQHEGIRENFAFLADLLANSMIFPGTATTRGYTLSKLLNNTGALLVTADRAFFTHLQRWAFATVQNDQQRSLYCASPGEIRAFAFTPLPTGWLVCNGAAISKVGYSLLYAQIGTNFGDPGGGNFNIPDLRGKCVVCTSDLDGDYDLGDTGGEKAHQLAEGEMPTHDHNVVGVGDHAHAVDMVNVSNWTGWNWPDWSQNLEDLDGSGSTFQTAQTNEGGEHEHAVDDSGESRDSAHNNLSPYITIQYGIYGG